MFEWLNKWDALNQAGGYNKVLSGRKGGFYVQLNKAYHFNFECSQAKKHKRNVDVLWEWDR